MASQNTKPPSRTSSASNTTEHLPTPRRSQRITGKLLQWTTYLGIKPKNRQQLTDMLHKVAKENVIDNESLEMIQGVLRVSEMQVRDIMIPRAQMIVVNPLESFKNALSIILKSAHSRFPVMGEDNKVKGILLAKDLLRFSYTPQKKPPNFHDLIHKATFVPESKRLDKLLSQFRFTYNHMAIVVDEYNNVAGLVTIEDILEQIVGSIEDEHYIEPNQQNILPQNSGEYHVQALTPIEEFNHYFETDFDEKEFDTIGGLVAQRFGRLPRPGEAIEINGIVFYVLKAKRRKIDQLKVTVVSRD